MWLISQVWINTNHFISVWESLPPVVDCAYYGSVYVYLSSTVETFWLYRPFSVKRLPQSQVQGVFLLWLPPQVTKDIQNAWDCACGDDTGVNVRHGLSIFPYLGVVMAFIFTPGKQKITLLSSCTSLKVLLANLFPGWRPSHLGVLGRLRMFRGICLVSHRLSLFPPADSMVITCIRDVVLQGLFFFF